MRKRDFADGPVFDDIADDFVTDDLGGFQGGKVGGVIAGDQGLEAVGGGGAGGLAVEIADGAKDKDALEVDAAGLAQKSE